MFLSLVAYSNPTQRTRLRLLRLYTGHSAVATAYVVVADATGVATPLSVLSKIPPVVELRSFSLASNLSHLWGFVAILVI